MQTDETQALPPEEEERLEAQEDAAHPWEALRPKQRAFLAAYIVCGTQLGAEEASGVSRRSHSRWMESPDRYAAYVEAFSEARRLHIEYLENEARRRAVEGVRRVKVHAGKVVKGEDGQPVYEIDYSDTLLLALLSAKDPHRYGKKLLKMEHSGPEEGPIPVTFQTALEKAYGAEEADADDSR